MKKFLNFTFFRSLSLLSIVTLSLGITSLAQARSFQFDKEERVNLRAQEIKGILLDFENTCEKDCKYKISSVVKIKFLKQVGPNDYYTWQHIRNMKTVTTFQHIQVSESENGQDLKMTVRFPPVAERNKLRREFRLSHDTMFSTTNIEWNIKEVFNERGDFLYTLANYQIKMFSSSMWAGMFAGKINAEIRKTANELFALFSE